jgi:hypothetical protein
LARFCWTKCATGFGNDAGLTEIKSPTPHVWIIGRTRTDGPADYAAVHAIQDGYKITPLSQAGGAPTPPKTTPDPTVDMKTPPKIQVDTMSGEKYFTYAAELLKVNPPQLTDQPMVARMKRIGIEPGKSLDFGRLDPVVQKAMAAAPEAGLQLMKWKLPTLARVANGWSMNTDAIQIQRRWLTHAPFPGEQPGTRARGKLAALSQRT